MGCSYHPHCSTDNNISSRCYYLNNVFVSYPAPKFLTDQRLENFPDQVENKRLIDNVHFFESQRHRILEEKNKIEGKVQTIKEQNVLE